LTFSPGVGHQLEGELGNEQEVPPSPRRTRLNGIAFVLLASALWGASGSLTKILRVHGFAITDILSWRYLCGLLTLLAVSRVLGHASTFRLSRVRFRPALVMALSTGLIPGLRLGRAQFSRIENWLERPQPPGGLIVTPQRYFLERPTTCS